MGSCGGVGSPERLVRTFCAPRGHCSPGATGLQGQGRTRRPRATCSARAVRAEARAQSSPGGGCACAVRPPRPHPLPGASAARGREWAAPGSALGGPGQTGPTGAPRPPSGRRPGPFHACWLAAGPAAPCGKSYGASGRPQRLCPLECRPCRPCEVCGRTGGQEGEVRRLGPRHGLLYRPPFPGPPGTAVRCGEVGGIWVCSKA